MVSLSQLRGISQGSIGCLILCIIITILQITEVLVIDCSSRRYVTSVDVTYLVTIIVCITIGEVCLCLQYILNDVGSDCGCVLESQLLQLSIRGSLVHTCISCIYSSFGPSTIEVAKRSHREALGFILALNRYQG